MNKLGHSLTMIALGALLAACGSQTDPQPQRATPSMDADDAMADGTAPLPVGVIRCEGVRPGAAVFIEGSQCTLNFLYRDGTGVEYAGTAGHCALGGSAFGGEDAGEAAFAPDDGPEARDLGGSRIGTIRYAVLSPPKDFALIQLDNGVASNPQTCHFGGPTGINNETSATPIRVSYYGSGLLLGDLLPARSALALSITNPDEIFLTGAALPGDSGAGVLDAQGRAVGVLVTVGALLGGIGTDGVDVGTIGVTRLAPQLQRAREVIGRPGLQLVTAPLP